MQFLIGVIFGIIIATVGFTGVAHLLDRAVDVTKQETTRIVNESGK
jgi:hypothetical protein